MNDKDRENQKLMPYVIGIIVVGGIIIILLVDWIFKLIRWLSYYTFDSRLMVRATGIFPSEIQHSPVEILIEGIEIWVTKWQCTIRPVLFKPFISFSGFCLNKNFDK